MAAALILFIAVVLTGLTSAKAPAVDDKNLPRNLLVNPDFARTFPARRLSGDFQRTLPGFEGKAFLPSGYYGVQVLDLAAHNSPI